jgi:ElaA protein
MKWTLKKFEELTVQELYAILRLRSEVFVVEQNCVYHDPDNKDQEAWHLMGVQDNKLVAYTRLMSAGNAHPLPTIGRVVTASSVRRSGLGRELMQRSVEHCEKLFGKTAVQLAAQLYLKKFYESLGFLPTGDIYLEDGIEHIKMKKPAL